MGLQLIGMCEPCEACALGKAKKARVSMTAVPCSTVKEKRLLINISSPSTASMGGKKHWLLTVVDSTDDAWSLFLKEKSGLKINVVPLKGLKDNL